MIELDSIGSVTVIDADSHVTEPADLWTSRMPKRVHDRVPRVETHPGTGHSHWKVGETFIWPVGYLTIAGWDKYPPSTPWEFEEVDPGGFDPKVRLQRLDEYGVDMQILYPNIVGFEAPLIHQLGGDLAIECIRVYNDFLSEWCSADPTRLIPIAMLPYWDREAAVAEMHRCIEMGHRGVLFANKFERVDLPSFADSYWDPVYGAAAELGVSINYHVGFALPDFGEYLTADALAARRAQEGMARDKARVGTTILMGQGDVMGSLLLSGICDRFPSLKFVAVESGFGYMPFYLEALDWHVKAYGVSTGELLPSEYFRRQCYGTFWFERTTLGMLEYFPDNFMFSTDFPHGISLSPGPASPADLPRDHLVAAFANIKPDLASKAISGNARAVYGLHG